MEEKGPRMELGNTSNPNVSFAKELDKTEGQDIESTKKLYQTPIADPDSWLSEEISHNIILTTVD